LGVTFTAKVQALGRVAIPKDLREVLSIMEGDLLEVEIRKITRSAMAQAASVEEKKARHGKA
jgi:AbrB family looped-hinge helix DNA binding protein